MPVFFSQLLYICYIYVMMSYVFCDKNRKLYISIYFSRLTSRIIIRFIFHWPMKIYITLSVIYLRKWSIGSSMTLSNHDHQPHFSLSSSPTIRFVVIAPFIGPHHGGWRHHLSYILSFSFYPNLAEWTYDSRSMVKRNNKSIKAQKEHSLVSLIV